MYPLIIIKTNMRKITHPKLAQLCYIYLEGFVRMDAMLICIKN